MPTLDGGIFVILVSLGFGALIASSRFGAFFAIIGAVAFFALSLAMFSNYDVAFVEQTADATSTINQTKYLIGNGDIDNTDDEQKIWVGWIFMMLGLSSIGVFFVRLFKLSGGRTDGGF